MGKNVQDVLFLRGCLVCGLKQNLLFYFHFLPKVCYGMDLFYSTPVFALKDSSNNVE